MIQDFSSNISTSFSHLIIIYYYIFTKIISAFIPIINSINNLPMINIWSYILSSLINSRSLFLYKFRSIPKSLRHSIRNSITNRRNPIQFPFLFIYFFFIIIIDILFVFLLLWDDFIYRILDLCINSETYFKGIDIQI